MEYSRAGGLRLRLSWLPERAQRWRLQRGWFTGRWTQEEIDRARAEGARRANELRGLFE